MSKKIPLVSALIAVALLPLTGCSTIDKAERLHEAFASTTEADRQYNLGNVAQGRIWLQRAVDLTPTDPAIYDKGDNNEPGIMSVAQDHGDYAFLASLIEKTVKQPGIDNVWTLYEPLGDAYEHLGNLPATRTAYSEGLAALDREFPSASASLPSGQPVRELKAEYEWKSGATAQAKADFDDVIRLSSDWTADAQNVEAYFMAQDGTDLSTAESLSLASLKSVEPMHDEEMIAEYQDTLAWVYYQQWAKGKDKSALDKSIEYEEHAANGMPDLGDVHLHLAAEYEAAGRYSDAAVELYHMASIESANPLPRQQADLIAATPNNATVSPEAIAPV